MSSCTSFLKVSFLAMAAWVGVFAMWLGYKLRDPAHAVPSTYLVQDCGSNPLTSVQQQLAHPEVPYRCGIVKLFSSPNVSVEAYVQPDGGKGWSNAGRIKAYGHVYQVDSLMDRNLAGAMDSSSELGPADTFILTHPHPDHIGGITAYKNLTTAIMHEKMRPVVEGILGAAKGEAKQQAAAYYLYEWFGQYLQRVLNVLPLPLQRLVVGLELGHYFAQFDPEKPEHLPVDVATFNGDSGFVHDHIELKCFGPTHSSFDCMVIVPEAKVVFTGDLLFVGVTPIMTSGSAQKWLNALIWLEQRIDSSWKVVPGHGPVTSVEGVVAVKHYFRTLQDAVRQEGCSCLDDHTMCGLGFYSSPPDELRGWTDFHRAALNAHVECGWMNGQQPDQGEFINLFVDAEVLGRLQSSQ